MRLIKYTLSVAVLVVGGLFAFAWFASVNEPDVYAFHETNVDTDPMLLTPGSVVALSTTGDIFQICRFELEGGFSPVVETSIYYNQLREDFPRYIRTIGLVQALMGKQESPVEEAAAPDQVPTGVQFTGRNLIIENLQDVATEFGKATCERDMAWYIARGYRACTVQKVLNRVVLQDNGAISVQTVAVGFAPFSNFVTPAIFEKNGITYNEMARDANGKKCKASSLPWTSVVKRKLNVIQRVTVDRVALAE